MKQLAVTERTAGGESLHPAQRPFESAQWHALSPEELDSTHGGFLCWIFGLCMEDLPPEEWPPYNPYAPGGLYS
jgi:hypothetical protein